MNKDHPIKTVGYVVDPGHRVPLTDDFIAAQAVEFAPPLAGMPSRLTYADRRAIGACERDCALAGTKPTDEDRAAWVHEWRGLDEDTNLDALDHQPYPQP